MPEIHNKIAHRKKILTVFLCCGLALVGLFVRLVYLMIFEADYYAEKATQLHERERSIKAARGRILTAPVRCWPTIGRYAPYP